MYFRDKVIFSILLICTICMLDNCIENHNKIEVWFLNNTKLIGEYQTTIIGNPKVVKTEKGEKCLQFDGIGDGLLVESNPIASAEEFSIEVVFKPFDSFPANIEQRFLHIQDPNNENRRILMELRLNDKKKWYADFFMCAQDKSLTLIDSSKTHPVNEWVTMKLVYKKGLMEGYVNGVKESAGKIEYLTMDKDSKTSIGTRMNKRSWFNGTIAKITFSHEVINP